MGQILDETLNNHFDGSSCSEFRNMILNSYSSNLHTGRNFLELYFQNILETLAMRQPPNNWYFVFSKTSFAVMIATVFLNIKSNHAGFIEMASFSSYITERAGLLVND